MTREAALATALVELADTLMVDYDALEHLYRLTERCTEVLDAAAAGVLLMQDAQLNLAAASSHELRTLEVFEAQQREGPGMEAYRAGQPVGVDDLAADAARWPDFVAQALELGYSSVQAHPLRLREERIGALSVFWSERRAFDERDPRISQGLADMATIGILHERALAAAHDQVDHLRRALDTRAVVEQAKALLAERLNVDTGDAFDCLRRYARDRNQRLPDVAQRVLRGELSAQRLVPRKR